MPGSRSRLVAPGPPRDLSRAERFSATPVFRRPAADDALISAMQHSPALLDGLLRTLGGLVRRLTEQASDLVFLDLGGRIAKLLVQQAERQSDDPAKRLSVDLHLTQTELAQMVGASRPAVNRVLQSLVGRGWISVDGKTLVIKDAAALRRRAAL